MIKHLYTRHAIKLQDCHVSDCLQTDAASANDVASHASVPGDDGNSLTLQYPALSRCRFTTSSMQFLLKNKALLLVQKTV